jgi:hypothetical protein
MHTPLARHNPVSTKPGEAQIVRLPGMFDVFGEAMPLGERSFSVGGGVAF